MTKERYTLELIKEVCDFYYPKTKDEWYKKVSKQVEKKLNQK